MNEVELVPFGGWLEEDGGDGGGQKDHLESHLPCTKTRQSSTSDISDGLDCHQSLPFSC